MMLRFVGLFLALGSGEAFAQGAIDPAASHTPGTASPDFGIDQSVSLAIPPNVPCDTSKWAAYYGSTLSPVPSCFATKAAGSISIPFPAVIGINAATPGDQTHIQYGQHVVQAQTVKDNTHQEAAMVSNFVSRTGGGGLPQTNWNEKVNLYLPTLVVPGGSNTWALNDDLHIQSGVGNYSMYRHEGDMTNFNGDYAPGGCSPCTGIQINGNAVGDFLTFTGYPVTAGTMVSGTPNPGSANMHYGTLFQAIPGFTAVGTGLVSEITINDSTNAANSYQIYGNHTTGFNTTTATLTYAVATAQGQSICLNVFDACWAHLGTNMTSFSQNGGFVIHLVGNSSAANTVSIQNAPARSGPVLSAVGSDPNIPLNLRGKGTGPVQVTGELTADRIIAPFGTPASSAAPCGRGQIEIDADYIYTCVAPNRWHRIANGAAW